MKQYSSNGCNIFAFNILVKDGYDGILRQYEVLCTRDAVTCITCRCMWSSTVQVKSRYYHSYYNSFTAWPQRVTSSHLTFPCSHANNSLWWVAACKPGPRRWAFHVSLWWTKAKNKTKQKTPKVQNISHSHWKLCPWNLQVSSLRSVRKQLLCCHQSTGSWLTTSCDRESRQSSPDWLHRLMSALSPPAPLSKCLPALTLHNRHAIHRPN